MTRAGVGDEAVVGAGRVHLLLERRDFGVGDEPVLRTVADEDLGLDAPGGRPVHRAEGAVEAHHRRERHAETRGMQDDGAAETVADRRHARRVDGVV